ncbi:hypothetical protein [Leptothrix discophora]|uniref:Secreted protein n=1 Tax=Leptothrix discophora TaxID=89 RepID=A0ABT9G750_LEPDI|nr:hypothetical protein [Leptothrix discophora]MDP4302250.1 hypothetical protein [Leptothrix discophora]
MSVMTWLYAAVVLADAATPSSVRRTLLVSRAFMGSSRFGAIAWVDWRIGRPGDVFFDDVAHALS